jgi:hypothetical protein
MAKKPRPRNEIECKLLHSRVIALFSYDPETGILTRKSTGLAVGYLEKSGYLRVSIDGERHLVHRVIFFYVKGFWPPDDLDHEDTVRTHNVWKNLRPADRSQSSMNRGMRIDNTSGIKGVNWREDVGKWQARISAYNKRVSIGFFESISDAATALEEKRIELHGKFGRSR